MPEYLSFLLTKTYDLSTYRVKLQP